jgi:hypothetical protein
MAIMRLGQDNIDAYNSGLHVVGIQNMETIIPNLS